jgi:hypothetical protein
MRVFNCDHCGHLVFFDSVQCLHCGSALAFLPDQLTMAALTPAPQDGPDLWRRLGERGTAQYSGRLYRMCHNHTAFEACNFAVPSNDYAQLCVSCRQTRLLPDLSDQANLGRWQQIESAKRQLFYTLARLGLEPAPGRAGPVFEFLADLPGGPAILTGHQGGTITLNVAEADDDERARRRVALGEPYRTLIGHLRHESGHFYWDQLVRDGNQLDAFRSVFGDERQDYAAALDAHYAHGGSGNDWFVSHVSAYAAAHPWEDWAETWAHYLHMVDLLETAASYQATVTVPDPHLALRHQVTDPFATTYPDFHDMVRQWVPLTLMLNSLNRSLGQHDAYPFALSSGAMVKLRFVHDIVQNAQRADSSALALASSTSTLA